MVLFSFVTMVAGAVLPGFGPDAEETAGPARVVDETVTTLGYAPGVDFARVSVVWVEMDGTRIAEDAWGEGRIDELKFKVGIKRAEGNALRLGERTVPLTPTDVFTIRGFSGRYSFADVGTGSATLALDGTVKNTLVASGRGGDVVTHGPALLESADRASGGTRDRLAYVVLDSGDATGTVEVAQGEARKLFTSGPQAAGERAASALDVRWVKIDDKLVTRYAYGEGEVPRISFSPDGRFRSSLNFSGLGLTFAEGDRVEVRDFLGTWSVTMRPGGGARLKLDGWASNADVVQGSAVANSDPSLAFTYEPLAPTTKDLVTFRADAQDSDGSILAYEWTFLRKVPDTTRYTTDDLLTATANGVVVEHRFTRPGTWEVTLRVVDDQGGTATVVQDLVVGNTAPAAAFDWFPDSPVTLDQVRFYDRSTDLDGSIVSVAWDFGDNSTSREREPVKAYAKNGLYEVTLTVKDDEGATSTVQHVLNVRNAAPDCALALDPPEPRAFEVVTLLDRSTDREGEIQAWHWKVRDLDDASVAVAEYTVREPQHTFTKADRHLVELTVTDAQGAATTCSLEVPVQNTAPTPGFTVWPISPVTREFTWLNSTAYDADGRLVRWEWRIEGDPEVKNGNSIGYAFPASGIYDVELTVYDNGGALAGLVQQVTVRNAPPVPSFVWSPTSPFTGTEVEFTDASRDPDGDVISSWSWTFGSGTGAPTASGSKVTHTFADSGAHNVTLTVADSNGNARSLTQTVLVLNRPPEGDITYSPSFPVAGQDVTFTTDATDPDGTVTGITWLFGDGGSAQGASVVHNFTSAGTYAVKLVLTDDEGGQSEVVLPDGIEILQPGPLASFTVEPTVGAVGRTVKFHDQSKPQGDAAIAEWLWKFGDGSTSTMAGSVTHKYADAGRFDVELTVEDTAGGVGKATLPLEVTHPPRAIIDATAFSVKSGESVTFTDKSSDPDGVIASRVWTVDGTAVSSDPQFSWTFTGRGLHPVTLTVTDDLGVSTTSRTNITVLNTPPTADFYVEGGKVVRGQTATFVSSATDPDGTILKWSWTVNGLLAEPNSSTFAFRPDSLGALRVEHEVKDDGTGVNTHRIARQVPIYADFDSQHQVLVRYSDGTPAPLDRDITFKDVVSGQVYSAGNGVVVNTLESSATLVLPAETWTAGQIFRVYENGIATAQFSTDEDAFQLVRVIVVPKRFTPPELDVADGTEPGDLGHLPGLLDLFATDALYPSGEERVRGSVRAAWKSPAGPAEGAWVQVWMNHTGPANVFRPQLACSAPRCVMEEGYAAPDGSFNFTLPYTSAPDLTGTATNLPGWYTVETVVSWPPPADWAYVPSVRTSTTVFVDAEGALSALFWGTLP